MSLKKALMTAHQCLTSGEVPHALIGGFALAALGVPRATADVDFLIDGAAATRAKIEILKAGFSVVSETPEFIFLRGPCQLDLQLAKRPLSKSMIAQSSTNNVLGIPCVTVENLIALKVQAFANQPKRELQDKADIQNLMRIHAASLDLALVRSYAELFQKWPEIELLWKTK